MKKRQGFVSNSSSSSFIIGIAKVEDKDRFIKYISDKDFEIGGYDCIKLDHVFQERTGWGYSIEEEKDDFYIETFTGSRVSIPKKELTALDEIVYISYEGNEGDSDFSCGYGDINYDIDEDFFHKDEQKVISLFKDKYTGLSNIEYKIGAGRNG